VGIPRRILDHKRAHVLGSGVMDGRLPLPCIPPGRGLPGVPPRIRFPRVGGGPCVYFFWSIFCSLSPAWDLGTAYFWGLFRVFPSSQRRGEKTRLGICEDFESRFRRSYAAFFRRMVWVLWLFFLTARSFDFLPVPVSVVCLSSINRVVDPPPLPFVSAIGLVSFP